MAVLRGSYRHTQPACPTWSNDYNHTSHSVHQTAVLSRAMFISCHTIVCQQNKAYPRQWWVRGRVRVQLLNEDGSLVNPFIPNRECLESQQPIH